MTQERRRGLQQGVGVSCLRSLCMTGGLVHALVTSSLTASDSKFDGALVDMIPNLYGGDGIFLKPSDTFSHAAHFVNDSLMVFNDLSLAVRDLSFPIVSAQAGVRFKYDPVLDDFVSEKHTEGVSAFALDATTVEKGAFYLGFSFSTRSLNRLDGAPLSDIVVDLKHIDIGDPGSDSPCIGGPPGACYAFERDVVRLNMGIELDEQMFAVSGTYGLTDRMDISAFIPVLVTEMSVVSEASIIEDTSSVYFPVALHEFDMDGDQPLDSLNARRTGLGDVVVRLNYLLTSLDKEGWSVAAGADVRLPTGNTENLQGLPGLGVRSRLAVSRKFSALGGNIQPHLNIAYAFNASANKEDAFEYAVGASYTTYWNNNDSSISLSADVLGKHFSNGDSQARYDLSTGINFRLLEAVSFYYHILWPLNDNGLRATDQHLFGLQAVF